MKKEYKPRPRAYMRGGLEARNEALYKRYLTGEDVRVLAADAGMSVRSFYALMSKVTQLRNSGFLRITLNRPQAVEALVALEVRRDSLALDGGEGAESRMEVCEKTIAALRHAFPKDEEASDAKA